MGKPRTPGRGRRAKAPSLREEGVQREPANQVPSERARCPLMEGMLAKEDQAQRNASVNAVEMETDAAWFCHGDGPQVLSRMR